MSLPKFNFFRMTNISVELSMFSGKTFYCFLLLITISATLVNGHDCEAGWTSFQSNCYKFFSEELKFPEAEAKCVSVGSHVSSIHSTAENEFITNLGSEASKMWVGATWDGDKWVWTDGSAWAFTHWWIGEPNDPNKEPCIGQWKERRSKWNDVWCDLLSYPFVCKKGRKRYLM